MTARWRLQLLAEMDVGWQVRAQQRGTDRKVAKLRAVTNGSR